MKRLLIIALLFWGCEGFGVMKHTHDSPHEGICVRAHCSSAHCWNFICYSAKYDEYECDDLVYYYEVSSWYTTLTCEEYCEGHQNEIGTGEDDCAIYHGED